MAVVIPLFNGGPWIQQTLESVLAQTRPAAEVVVVDDGSTDDSREMVAARFPQVRLERSPEKGGGHARDHGIAVTDAPLLTFLDQDDLWSPTHLERLVGILEQDPTAVAVAADSVAFEGEEGALDFGDQEPVHSFPIDPWRNYPFGTFECPSLLLLRRSVLEKTGRWQDQTRYMADLELALRIANEGSVRLSDTVTVGRRVHRASYSGALRKDGARYLGSLREAAETLAPARRSKLGGEAEKADLEVRLRIAEEFGEIGEQIGRHDLDAIAGGVNRVLDLLRGELLTNFRGVALANLVWFLAPEGGSATSREIVTTIRETIDEEANPDLAALLDQRMESWPISWLLFHWWKRQSEDQRKVRLQRGLRRRLRGSAILPWQGVGIDADGWVKGTARLRLPGKDPRFRKGARLMMERPGWHELDMIEVSARRGREAPVEVRMERGQWVLRIPGSRDPGMWEIEFSCAEVEPIPDDGRSRAFRLTGFEPDEGEPSARLQWHRENPGRRNE